MKIQTRVKYVTKEAKPAKTNKHHQTGQQINYQLPPACIHALSRITSLASSTVLSIYQAINTDDAEVRSAQGFSDSMPASHLCMPGSELIHELPAQPDNIHTSRKPRPSTTECNRSCQNQNAYNCNYTFNYTYSHNHISPNSK